MAQKSDNSLPIEVDLPAFIAKKQQLLSLKGEVVEVHRETPKSFEVDLAAVFVSRSSCWRCSRTITNAKSLQWGVGPDCAASLGLPYEDGAPDDFPNHGEFHRKRLYLPKSLLSERQILTLRVYAQETDTEDPLAKCSVTTDESWIYLKAPFVNKKFVDELKAIPGRDWDFMQKFTRFPASDQSMHDLCEVLVRWKLLASLDDQAQAMLERYKQRMRHSGSVLNKVGVDSALQIRDLEEIDTTKYDWGLKPGIEPWQHQAKGILFAASLFGVEVKERKK